MWGKLVESARQINPQMAKLLTDVAAVKSASGKSVQSPVEPSSQQSDPTGLPVMTKGSRAFQDVKVCWLAKKWNRPLYKFLKSEKKKSLQHGVFPGSHPSKY